MTIEELRKQVEALVETDVPGTTRGARVAAILDVLATREPEPPVTKFNWLYCHAIRILLGGCSHEQVVRRSMTKPRPPRDVAKDSCTDTVLQAAKDMQASELKRKELITDKAKTLHTLTLASGPLLATLLATHTWPFAPSIVGAITVVLVGLLLLSWWLVFVFMGTDLLAMPDLFTDPDVLLPAPVEDTNSVERKQKIAILEQLVDSIYENEAHVDFLAIVYGRSRKLFFIFVLLASLAFLSSVPKPPDTDAIVGRLKSDAEFVRLVTGPTGAEGPRGPATVAGPTGPEGAVSTSSEAGAPELRTDAARGVSPSPR